MLSEIQVESAEVGLNINFEKTKVSINLDGMRKIFNNIMRGEII